MIRLKKRNTNRESSLLEAIENNPGIQFRQIMRKSGIKNGVLSHYLEKLEKNGLIKTERNPRQTRFYPLEITEDESKVIKALRRQTPRDLLLVQHDGLEFSQLVNKVGKSPSTVSFYLSQIVKEGLVESILDNTKKRYFLKTRKTIDSLIERYRPSLLERHTSEFEDIINSL